ncbi:MAG TPA: PepSY domain-containing protein [Pseudoxanthomonas sp.]|nr:PepSY domain-containing protein [Pseudoxanthomonas sp.]
MRKFNPLWLPVAAVLASGIALAQTAPRTAAPAAGTMTEARVRALLAEKGFTRIDDVDFEDGAFETDATSADGRRVDVRIDPATGRLYTNTQVSTLTEDDVKARLTAAGYSKVHDVDFEDGLWKAEADNALGNDVEVHLDPQDGRLLHVEND